jgi:hypothetical protein
VVVPLREDARQILVDKNQVRLPRISLVNFNFYIRGVLKLASIDEPVRISYKRGSQLIEETNRNMLGFHRIQLVVHFVQTNTSTARPVI